MFASDQSENEMESVNNEPEPEKDVKPILPKNKRRKSVKKTYEDDEGFIGKFVGIYGLWSVRFKSNHLKNIKLQAMHVTPILFLWSK